MKVEINLNDLQIAHLKNLNNNHYAGSKQNLCTNRPMHFVQSKVYNYYPLDYAFNFLSDYTISFYIGNWTETYDDIYELLEALANNNDYKFSNDEEKIQDLVISYEEAMYTVVNGIHICDEEDYIRAYASKFGYDYSIVEVVAKHGEYQDVAFFFTLDCAKNYMEYQSHNLSEPRTFSKSCGYSNSGDYEPLYDTLMALGKILNEGENENDTV